MSIKNFKISTGLDLEGLVLTNGDGDLLLDGSALATQQYVIDSLDGVDFDLSNNAGDYLLWDANDEQFDLNVSDLVTELTVNQLFALTTQIPSLDGYATESYVTTALEDYTPTSDLDTAIAGYGYAKTADLPTMYSDADAVDAIANVLVSGGGLQYVANTGFQVDTDIIASKAYVDGVAQGLDVKASVKAASTENVNLSSPPLDGNFVSIGGVTMDAGQRVLLKDQTSATQNGIYVVAGEIGSFTLTRSEDADSNGEFNVGAFTFVEQGTHAGKGFVVTSSPFLGMGNVVWTQFSEAGSFITSVSSELDVTSGVLSINTTLTDKTLESPTVTISNSISVPSSSSNLIYGSSGGTPFVAFSTNVNLALGSLSIGTTVTIPSGLVGAGTYTITSLTDPVGFSSPFVGYTISDPENALSNVFMGGGGDSIATGYTIVVAAGSTTISSTELSYLDGVSSNIQAQLDAKQATLQFGNGIAIDISNTLSIDLNDIAGTGITVNGNQLEAAPAYIESVDASFAVTDGELSLSDTITIASVELTDSVANVTAASDVFGNANTSTYAMGSAVTIGTLPTGAEVGDVFVTLKATSAGVTSSRTSKLTYVNTGGDAPTWTEYGIIVSGAFPATTVSFDSSGNIIANVTGSSTYSVKGVVTILK